MSTFQLLERNGCLERVLLIFGICGGGRSASPQTLHCRLLVLHKAARDGQLRGWAASGKASERLTGQAGDGSQALLPILCSLPNGGHQLLGLPRWNYASQKTRRPPLSKSVVPGNNVDKYITQRRIRSLSFLLLTHHTITTMYRDCVMVLLRYIQTFGLKSAK